MHHFIYISSAVHPFTNTELQDLLTQAREYNTRNAITGVLLYHDGQFMQLIEGSLPALTTLYEKICRDPRHKGVVKMADKSIAVRSFSEWSMAFCPVGEAEFTELLGYIPPNQLSLTREGFSRADSLLLERMQAYMSEKTS